MADDMDAEDHVLAEAVPPEGIFSIEEGRRHFVLQHGAPYLANLAGEHILPIEDIIKVLGAIERWLVDGMVPQKPIDPRSKLSVVRPPDAPG